MSRRCTCCASDENGISVALIDGVPQRRIALQFGVSRSAVQRHRRCIPEIIRRERIAAAQTFKS